MSQGSWREQLAHANAVRFARSELRRALKRREIELRAALDHPAAQTMAVMELLAYLPARPRSGRARVVRRADAQARAIASRALILSETVPVSALSANRRDQLAAIAAETVPESQGRGEFSRARS